MTSTLAATYSAVRARWDASGKTSHPESWLESAFHVVEKLPEAECRALLDEASGMPLTRNDSDIVQHCIARLGVDVVWRHVRLEGDRWEKERGE